MEKRIDLERRARDANQITDLNLDNCRSTSIVGLNDEYTALETLSLINVGLTTLKGFPKLPNLKKLELSDNRIPNGLHYLHTSPKLQYLNLSGNKIKDLEALKPLEEFKQLAILDLFNNEATQIENYRDKIFEMLPSLKFLDGFDCNDLEAPSECDDDDGSFSIDEDKQNAFNFNGIEIDLDELEAFEKRVKAKREAKQQNTTSTTTKTTTDISLNTTNDSKISTTNAVAEVDELDEYLKTLKLKEEEEETTKDLSTCHISNTSSSHPLSTVGSDSRLTSMNFAIFLYWFLAILNLASATFYTEGDNSSSSVSDEEPGSDEEFSSVDDEDNGDVSLSEVYNDDLEEDEDDWVQQNNAENDDDEESDEDDANESAVASADKAGVNNTGADEPEARGKKRKHEG